MYPDRLWSLHKVIPTCFSEIIECRCRSDGPGSSVGIATDYGLDGPGSNPGGDEIFRPSRPALGPTQPPVKWVPGLSRGVNCGRGVLLTTHPLLVPRSWKSRAIPLPTLWATPGLYRDHFTFTFICRSISKEKAYCIFQD